MDRGTAKERYDAEKRGLPPKCVLRGMDRRQSFKDKQAEKIVYLLTCNKNEAYKRLGYENGAAVLAMLRDSARRKGLILGTPKGIRRSA